MLLDFFYNHSDSQTSMLYHQAHFELRAENLNGKTPNGYDHCYCVYL